ncbi:hypothetical protein PTSG_03798 [Salpingoeca rosetta]|uniref:Uncharacterized protein n=1 Tax=Salpingoeca rosetta (strain ATCC 50818 / BSB-021) TaxID=946362 RepID=F2U5F1_SALR5|nr:uncharacterized protein PTSG_03798 [Salpingoeca rosetta]EGD83167.1 hypothetical protein PTSG_03798 [Salpingoeca rosetta]|eukprot:XP_004995531.1 hypothetical protein PTSG_03798 [Salpingoeca rosetta]
MDTDDDEFVPDSEVVSDDDEGELPPTHQSGHDKTCPSRVGLSTVRRKYAMLNKLLQEHGIDGLKTLSVENRRGKATQLPTRVPTTKRVLRQVRDHVRMQREGGHRITAVQVLDFLRKHRHVDVRPSFAGDGDDELDRAAALRAVQRFLRRAGYLRGNKHVVQENPRHKQLLAKYLKEFDANRRLPPDERLRDLTSASERCVYLDESYIDRNYNRNRDSLHELDLRPWQRTAA